MMLIAIWLWPAIANANMGVPYFMYVQGAYLALLIPVIVIEAIVINKRLSLERLTGFGVSTVVNIASAILGFFVLFGVEMAFAKAGFEAWYGWPAKVPFFVFLVPGYFISVGLEALIALPFIRSSRYRNLVRAFLVANLYSYALLAILGIAITLPPF